MPSRAATKLSSYCEALMEAAWLACLIVTPLLFNVRSSGVFEPDKTAVVRSLALVVSLAGLTRWVDRAFTPVHRGGDDRTTARRGHAWAAVALVYLFAQVPPTVMSVAPYISFWGSSTRLQGLYTTAAYIVLFLTVLTFCRRRVQVERIIQACLLASIPASLYAIIQRFGTDPIPWTADVSLRPGSTIGNPVFLGAFLIMVAPLTLYRYAEVGRIVTRGETVLVKGMFIGGGIANILFQLVAWAYGPVSGSLAALVTLGLWTAQGIASSRPLRPFLRTGVYSLLLSAQLAAILASGSRGPLLALLVGLSMFASMWALVRGKWQWLTATAVAAGAVVVGLVLLNHPRSPFQGAQPLAQLTTSRFAHLLEGSGRVRLLLWEGAVELIGQEPSRLVWGYGPETAQLVMPRHVPPELGRLAAGVPDRSHNETFDVLVGAGLLGLAAYLVLFTGVLVRGVRWAGAARTRERRRLVVGMCLSGGIAIALATRAVDGSWRLLGLALPAGLLGGALIYLLGLIVKPQPQPPRWCNRRSLAVLLFSALLAHLVETQVGIAIASTRVYFWVLMALLVGTLGGPAGQRDVEAVALPRARVETGLWSHLCPGLLATLTVTTLVYDFAPARESSLVAVGWLVVCSWLLAVVMLIAEAPRSSPRAGPKALLSAYVALPLAGVSLLAALQPLPSLLSVDTAPTPLPFYVALLVLVTGLASGLAACGSRRFPGHLREGAAAGAGVGLVLGSPGNEADGVRARLGSGTALGAGVGLAALTMVLIATTNLDFVRADVRFKQAQSRFVLPGQVDEAERQAARAVAILPSRDHLRGVLGQIRTRQAELAGPTDRREEIYARAEDSLQAAYELTPLRASNSVNLARLSRSRATHAAEPEGERTLLERAVSSYRNALRLDPTSFRTWNELASAYVQAERIDEAEAALERSLALNDRFSETHVEHGRLRLAQGDPRAGLESFQRAISLNAGSTEASRGLGITFMSLGRTAEASRAYENLLAMLPEDIDAHVQLARIYALMGRTDIAGARAQTALELASPEQRAQVERLVGEFLIQRPPAREGRRER